MLLWWITVRINALFAHPCRRKHGSLVHSLRSAIRSQPKPAWVVREIIRLKALMPDAGCRTISLVFNRRYAACRRMMVGKTFVADTLRRHRYEIEAMRRKIKHRVPRPAPRNLVWGLDLTGKGETEAGSVVCHGRSAIGWRSENVPLLVQPGAPAPTLGRAHPARGMARDRSVHAQSKTTRVVRGVGWVAARRVLVVVAVTELCLLRG